MDSIDHAAGRGLAIIERHLAATVKMLRERGHAVDDQTIRLLENIEVSLHLLRRERFTEPLPGKSAVVFGEVVVVPE